MIALGVLVALAVLGLALAYLLYPWLCRGSATPEERRSRLAGDELVSRATTGYTLGASIAAAPAEVWPWLAQMGQGRAGFYTHEWVEGLLGAEIHNVDVLRADLQRIDVGDVVPLTPDPYLGKPGQKLTVARVDAPHALALRQTMPNGSEGSWAFVLRPTPGGGTRLLFRRRGGRASAFDRIMLPGYYFMDRGMLAGIKGRAEDARARGVTAPAPLETRG